MAYATRVLTLTRLVEVHHVEGGGGVVAVVVTVGAQLHAGGQPLGVPVGGRPEVLAPPGGRGQHGVPGHVGGGTGTRGGPMVQRECRTPRTLRAGFARQNLGGWTGTDSRRWGTRVPESLVMKVYKRAVRRTVHWNSILRFPQRLGVDVGDVDYS